RNGLRGFGSTPARLGNRLRGEQQKQARSGQKAFLAISLKAGEHFHAIFSSGVALEASLVEWVAATLTGAEGAYSLAGVVSQNDVGASAFDARQCLQHHALFVNPALLRGRF